MKSLSLNQLYKACVLKDLPFKTTRQLEPLAEIVGQNRAQAAVRFALAMPHGGYNVYAVGRNGLGKRTMMLRYLEHHVDTENQSHDWCYVANFEEPRIPRVLQLPAGKGTELKQDMEKLMGRLMKMIPQTFDSDSFLERAEQLKNGYAKKQEDELEKVAAQAKRKKVSLNITTPGGYRLVAMNGEEPHTAESFQALTEAQRDKFENDINKLEKKLRQALRKLADWEQEYAESQQALNEETLESISGHQIDELIEKYRDMPEVVSYFEEVRKDLSESLEIFLEDNEEQAAIAYASLDKKMPRRYLVNVLVHQKTDEVPVVVEDNPTYHNLFGYVESVTFKGSVFTDFSLIRPGSIHRANGGYLLMDAIKVLEQPFVWDGLKRALRSKSIQINSLERELTLSGTISLEPEAIPLDVKIVLFGDRETWMLLQEYDPEFAELFRVTADFENEMMRTDESQLLYAKFIASLVNEKKLLHCSNKAVARVIEHSSRMAEHQDRLSLHAADIANLLRESDYWARQAGAKLIQNSHVDQALESAQYRSSRIRDQFYDSIRDGTTLVSTTGTCVGQVNALSVLSTGGFEFGLSNRITATCYYGDGGVMDIERDVKLGGNIHSKGVMILSSWLSAHFAVTDPMHLSASLTFEQNYGEVDGDSASLAELCALVSALSGLPVRQDLAITGSVNQFGEVQPIGGVNEKVEGFFSTCRLTGELTGTQGVIVPSTNVQNLMLEQEVVQAVRNGQFAVHAVSRAEEAITLLLGKPAGKADDKGRYPKQSVFGIIQQRLEKMREHERQEHARDDHKDPSIH
ncbi:MULTISPECIES: Lon protease family protein [Marinobacter]|uniref:Lon protease family protein n=1 Tax=Marinobacter TaxID=2742 RepID=UPI000F853FDB|nr:MULTISPECIES: ATP-binding protein [Marinobacter]AZR39844.1 endopeptidase La [Marinobacter salarius]MCZ4284612.1 ATP-binding protein [Marinobacter salarius]MDC8454862.1 AAA family ATPase [Marinobacter sp. DS40M6]MDM8181578.1 ATP-binding protein [Marinobacter salarius]RUT74094.1 ATP-binding protein [Marinobacter sp. NP-6]